MNSSALEPAARADPSGSERPRKHNLSPAEQQAAALSRLLANPDKEVRLPSRTKEKELRAPRETIKNVSGSSAGAGSGEFHVYKHARRREYERLKLLEDKAEKVSKGSDHDHDHKTLEKRVNLPSSLSVGWQDKASSSFLIEQAQKAASDDAKTNKNRAKRDKKKLAKERAKLAQASRSATDGAAGKLTHASKKRQGDGSQSQDTAPTAKKIKAAPGSEGLQFTRKQSDDSDSDTDRSNGEGTD